MKKFIAVLVSFIALAGAVYFALNSKSAEADNGYLRIHVRANSNSRTDQAVKYEIKDEVVKFITPHIRECVDKESAMSVMGGLLPQITEVCERALAERGYSYGARAEIRAENFPTRVYGDYTLEQGVYDALIVELGTGAGDNWWCVIYPPLCFTSATSDVEYRSIVYDIINKFKG